MGCLPALCRMFHLSSSFSVKTCPALLSTGLKCGWEGWDWKGWITLFPYVSISRAVVGHMLLQFCLHLGCSREMGLGQSILVIHYSPLCDFVTTCQFDILIQVYIFICGKTGVGVGWKLLICETSGKEIKSPISLLHGREPLFKILSPAWGNTVILFW